MQTFLLVSENDTFISSIINSARQKYNVSEFNYHEINTGNLKIEDARKIKKIIIEKPYGGGGRIIFIKNIEEATAEAANSLLKILEEPPFGTYFFLTCRNQHQVLPTILSRCNFISEPKNNLNKRDENKEIPFLKTILSKKGVERFLIWPQKIKSKDESIEFLDRLITILQKNLLVPSDLKISRSQVASCLKKSLSAKKFLERNVSYKGVLDMLFFGFPELIDKKLP